MAQATQENSTVFDRYAALEKIKNFKVRDSDIFLISQIRTGATLEQNLIWLLVNDLNYAENNDLFHGFPRLEACDSNIGYCYTMEELNGLKSPRCIATTTRLSYLPVQLTDPIRQPPIRVKMIYIYSDPRKDVISAYHFYKNAFKVYPGDFEDFYKLYISEQYDYFDQTLYFWNKRNDPNILFLKYKEMETQLPSVICKVAAFLEKKLIDKEITLLNHCLSTREKLKLSSKINQDFYSREDLMAGKKFDELKNWISNGLKGIDLV